MKIQHTQYKQMRSVGSIQVVAGIHRQNQTGKQTGQKQTKTEGMQTGHDRSQCRVAPRTGGLDAHPVHYVITAKTVSSPS